MKHAVLVEQIEEPPKGKQILTLPNHTKKISELENSSSIAEYFVNNVGCNNKLKNINKGIPLSYFNSIRIMPSIEEQ